MRHRLLERSGEAGYAGEVHIADLNASGSTYFAVATMAQLFGEDEAFKYPKAMYKGRGAADAKGSAQKGSNPGGKAGPMTDGDQGSSMSGGGKGGGRAGAADAGLAKAPPTVGSAIAGIGFVGDVVAEAEGGAPVKVVAPCEGTIFEVGALSIVKGARNLDNAKKFVDWALGAKAQALAAKARQYVYPANTAVAASPLAPKFGETKFISDDVARFEKSAARRHLIDRWSQEFGAASP